MISHEIRSPISSAIFQSDSMIDDLKSWINDINKFKEELDILNTLLIKIWDLVSKLFSVQYYDTQAISLYKEKIQISSLLETEFDVYSHTNENIKFIDNIDKKMWFIEIDKIQFRQVIENIITNAIKFVWKNNGIISLTSYIESNFLYVIIEDNWEWFKWIDISKLFEKYSTWWWNYIWLWMWLYLCKKIVEMHNWEIIPWISEKLSWAKFIIKIPVN
jgi:signal transduction histidine kinase